MRVGPTRSSIANHAVRLVYVVWTILLLILLLLYICMGNNPEKKREVNNFDNT